MARSNVFLLLTVLNLTLLIWEAGIDAWFSWCCLYLCRGGVEPDKFYFSSDEYGLQSGCKENAVEHREYVIFQKTLDKFADDKVLYEDDSVAMIVEGVIYNLAELKTGCPSLIMQFCCTNCMICTGMILLNT